MSTLQQGKAIPHLTGIRGVAIILVMLFHLAPSCCCQGFYGVDIFFALSGYFLVGRQLDAGDFSLRLFLKSRLCRLLPPLVVAILLASVAGIFVLPAIEACEAVHSGRIASFAWLNIFLERVTSSYFSEDARTMPMMHLWYMSVLLQCYGFFALLFYLWNRFKFSWRARMLCLAVVAFVSLCVQFRWCIYELWGCTSYAVSTYYWTVPRLWEFAAGAFAYCLQCRYPVPRHAPGIALVLLLLLAAACFAPIPHGTRWSPLAVFMALFVVLYGSEGLVGTILSNRFLVYIGAISFSLYLMHWPVICFAEYLFNAPVAGLDLIPVALIVYLLAEALYRTVEHRRWRWWIVVGAWGVTVVFCTMVPRFIGVLECIHPMPAAKSELPEPPRVMLALDEPFVPGTEMLRPKFWGAPEDSVKEPIFYHLGDTGKCPNFVLMGDSHAAHFIPAFSTLGAERGWSGLMLNSYVHPFWDSVYRDFTAPGRDFTDGRRLRALIDWLKRHPELKVVFIAHYWNARMIEHSHWNGDIVEKKDAPAERLRELRELCRELHAVGKEPVLIGETPTILSQNPRRVSRRFALYGNFLCRNKDNMVCSWEQYLQKTAPVQTMLDTLEKEGVCKVLHVERVLFQDGKFNAAADAGLQLSDSHHLTYYSALKALRSVADEISAMLLSSGSQPPGGERTRETSR